MGGGEKKKKQKNKTGTELKRRTTEKSKWTEEGDEGSFHLSA